MDQNLKARLYGLARDILTLVGGYLIGITVFGVNIDANIWQLVVGGVMALGGTLWSVYDKSVTIEKVQSGVRRILSTAGGILIAKGVLSPERLELVISIIVSAIPMYQSFNSRKKVQQIQQGVIGVHELKK